MARPTYTAIVKEIILALGGRLRFKDFLKYANEKYPGEIHEGSLNDHLYAMSVNSPSRLQYPENKKARGYNERLDILYKDENERGVFELYDPAKHGKWTIMLDHNGKPVLAKDGVPLSGDSEESNSEFEKIKKFCVEELPSPHRNYREIALKVLLESSNFTATKSEIGKVVSKLNPEGNPDHSEPQAGYEAAACEMIREYLVSKNGFNIVKEESDSFSLSLPASTPTEQVNELKKLCGHAIAKWHMQMGYMKDENQTFVIIAGSNPLGRWLDEFQNTKTAGCNYTNQGRIDLTNKTKDEIESIGPEVAEDGQELYNISQIKTGEIIAITVGQTQGIENFGIAVSDYYFDSNSQSYVHKVDVEYLNISTSEINGYRKGIVRAGREKQDAIKNFLLGEESESRNYWAIKAEDGEIPSWESMLSSEKILYGDLDIDLSEFYDEDGNYKHELPKRKKVSQELRDEIIKKDSEAKGQDQSWHAIVFQHLMSIKKNDIVVVWGGNMDNGYKINGYGKITSKYIFDGKDPKYFHQKSVEWINTEEKELTGELRKIGTTKLMSIHELPDEWKNWLFGKKQQNYFILTQNPDSKSSNAYEDISGVQYAYDNRKAHYTKFVEGTNFIVQSNIEGQYYFVGYGKVGKIEKSEETDDKGKPITKIIAKFSKYTEFEEQKIRTEEINKKMLRLAFPNKGSNPQPPAMLPITRSLYAEIIGEDLIDDDQLPDTLELDEFTRALEWKPNLILYGPPGTGKTYHAKKIAKKLTENQPYPHIWLWPVTPENWTVAVQKKTWGSSEEINKLKEIISKNDLVVFYVNTTNEIQGIFKFSGDWYQSKENIWHGDSDAGNDIKIDEICLGHLDIRTLHNILDLFKGAENINAINARLQSKGKIRRGPAKELTRKDFNIISERMGIREVNPFIKKVTFHQSFSYEEFIEGIKAKPSGDGKGVIYYVQDGIFKEFCNLAKDDPRTFVIIIDEINRGNIAKIFGELITIIEKDKRGDDVTLAYSREEFSVPENVLVIGTMNTADQSLTHLDAALKRRFTMMEIYPDSEKTLKHKKVNGIDLTELLDAVNKKLVDNKLRDNQIGHAYFMDGDDPLVKISDLQMVFAYDIIPLLREYFYDDESKLKGIFGKDQWQDWFGENDDINPKWQGSGGEITFRDNIKKSFGV